MIYPTIHNYRPSINKQKIIRTLLNNPEGNLTKYQIAKKSQCKFSTTHEILKQLDTLGLIKSTKVIDYLGLINAWRKWQIKPNRSEYLIKDPFKLLKKSKLIYALTTYVAENLVQKYLVPSIIDLYIFPSDKSKWHNLILSEEGLVGKGNTRLLIGDPHVFYNSSSRNTMNIVSLPQLILDLLNEGGVCTEAAEMLLSRVSNNAIPKL